MKLRLPTDAVVADDTVESVHNDCFENGDLIEMDEENDRENNDEIKTTDKDKKDAIVADDTVESVHNDLFENGDPIEMDGEKDRENNDEIKTTDKDKKDAVVADDTVESVHTDCFEKLSGQKEKKIAKKRQNRKRKLRVWKSQIKEKEKLKASEEEENEIIVQADNLFCAPIDKQLWGFCQDEDMGERESCESNNTNENETTLKCLMNGQDLQPHTSSSLTLTDLLPLNESRKRKSAAYESFEESEQGRPIEKN